MDNLTVHSYSSSNTCFTIEIKYDWFHPKTVLAIKKHQTENLKIQEDKVKTLVLLDNTPTRNALQK